MADVRAPVTRRLTAALAFALFVCLALPELAAAHAELESASPAANSTVAAPFAGPIVLTFSEGLTGASKVDLIGPDGSTLATAKPAPPGATSMNLTPTSPLGAGQYTVRWVSVAADGDLLRGTFTITVAAPTAPPASPATSSASAAPASASASASASAAASEPGESTGPSPSAEPSGGTGASTSDAFLPIVAALIVLAAFGLFLLRRRSANR